MFLPALIYFLMIDLNIYFHKSVSYCNLKFKNKLLTEESHECTACQTVHGEPRISWNWCEIIGYFDRARRANHGYPGHFVWWVGTFCPEMTAYFSYLYGSLKVKKFRTLNILTVPKYKKCIRYKSVQIRFFILVSASEPSIDS